MFHHIRFDGTLELADAEDLHLDVQFVQQPLGIGEHAAHTIERDRAYLVDIEFRSRRSYIILTQRITVVVGNQPLVRGTEVHQGIVQCLVGGRAGRHSVCIEIDTYDVRVVLGNLNGIQVATQRGVVVDGQTTHHVKGEWDGRWNLVDRTVDLENQHVTCCGRFACIAVGRYTCQRTDKENDAKEEASHAHDEHADHDRKDCFQERLHKSGNIKSSVFFILVSLSVALFPDIAARGT